MGRNLLIFVIASSFCVFVGAYKNPLADPKNTNFTAVWNSDPKGGHYIVYQRGVGLGGYDSLTCSTTTTRTLTLDWTTVPGAKIKKAYVFWQAESNATTDSYDLKIDTHSVKTGATALQTANYCNHLTGDHHVVMKRSTVWFKEVTGSSFLTSKLNGPAASVTFNVEFTTPCNLPIVDNIEKANGMTLVVVAENPLFSGGIVVQIQAGAVSYDSHAEKQNPPSFLFTIPPVGIADVDRIDNLFDMKVVAVIGEGEAQDRENSEGFIINSQPVDLIPIDGADGAKWDTATVNVGDCDASPVGSACVADTDTQLNVTVESANDCLIFVAFVVSYEVNGNSTSLGEDPHMSTWDGAKVTLKAEGDFVMVASPTTGLAVHTRFSKNVRGPWAPWTTAVAIRCSAESGLVEIHADAFDKPRQVGQDDIQIAALTPRVYQVSCPSSGLVVTAMRFRFHRFSYINVHFHPGKHLPSDTRGLLGSPNGRSYDDLSSREGLRFVPEKPKGHYIGHSVPELLAIQNSWKVQSVENIFSTPFTPTENIAKSAHARPEASMSREEATAACRNAGVTTSSRMLMCVHDAMATGSITGAANLVEWERTIGAIIAGVPMPKTEGY